MNKKIAIRLMWPLLGLIVISAVLFVERSGIVYKESEDSVSTAAVWEERSYSQAVENTKECLVLWNSQEDISTTVTEQMLFVLDGMKVGYDTVDLATEELGAYDSYANVIFSMSDYAKLGDQIIGIEQWVKEGGNLLCACTPEPNAQFQLIYRKLGILDGGTKYTGVSGFTVEEEFMIGAAQREFLFSDTSETSLALILEDSCEVYIKSVDNETPLMWEHTSGEGKYVVSNQILTGKPSRGLLCAAYSLLQEAFAYPVINSSTYYIDDFPSPVPSGDATYIMRDFGTDISTFYSNEWWPTLLEWEETYGIKHTGVIIEDYSDIVEAPFKRTESTERFTYFGNMLLNHGGELGFHGYNHMPLVTKTFDYKGQYDSYEKWPSAADIQAGLEELSDFSKNLFPSQNFYVYVPPSNILSEEGREVLGSDENLDIKVVASTFLTDPDNIAYVQEYGVAEDGVVEAPRITSGCDLDEYSYLVAFSELNFQYVQSHFLHPDDVLDEDRGAALGWETMAEEFEEYLKWITTSAPSLEEETGSEEGRSVEEYNNVSVQRTYGDNSMTLHLGGFSTECNFLLRLNEGETESVEGGEIEHITGNLYVIHAVTDTVTIKWREE